MENDLIKEIQRRNDDELCRIFRGKIKGQFMLEMRDGVYAVIGDELPRLFEYVTPQSYLNNRQVVDFEICKYIVGAHRANHIFVDDDTKKKNENDSAYRERLIADVADYVRIHHVAGVFFRRGPIFEGDDYMCFPLPYLLFAQSDAALQIISHDKNELPPTIELCAHILRECLAAMSLLGDNFLSEAYPLCRGAIEQFIKLLVLDCRKNAINEYNKFVELESEHMYLKNKYSKEFNTLYENKKYKYYCTKSAYLHFGWVDAIADYHTVVRQTPYTTNGLITFVKSAVPEIKPVLDLLEMYYKVCHGYTHGSVWQNDSTLLHYFEISFMLYGVVPHLYSYICICYDKDTKINGVDVIGKCRVEFDKLAEQQKRILSKK